MNQISKTLTRDPRNFLPEDFKTYVATLQLGQATDTGDCEGQLTAEEPHNALTLSQINSVFESFLGSQLQ